MRIVFAHNRYRFRGGEDESRDQEMAMLRNGGHDVLDYLVHNRDVPRSGYVSAGIGAIWNRDQYHRMRSFLKESSADILKVDNYSPLLSPSVFDAAKSLGIASVLSVRNYRLVCPAGSLFRDGATCTQCVGKSFAYPGVIHGCYRGSRMQTLAVALSNTYARIHKTWGNSIDQYIAVSQFVKDQLVLGGFPEEKISVKPNSIVDTGAGDGAGNYAVYVGRLTPEKGIQTLLDAWSTIGSKLPLKIIGEGSLQGVIEQAAKTMPGIEYLGRKTITEVCDILGGATALIFPSEWFEPFGRSVIESYSKGTPVIAADTPPMRDLIQPRSTGMLFRSGNSKELVDAVFTLLGDPELLSRMRSDSRKVYLEKYAIEQNYSQMMEIFNRALAGNAPRPGLLPIIGSAAHK